MVAALTAALLSILTQAVPEPPGERTPAPALLPEPVLIEQPLQAPGPARTSSPAPLAKGSQPSSCGWCPDTVELAGDLGIWPTSPARSGKPGAVALSLTAGYDTLRLGLSWLSYGALLDQKADRGWSSETRRWALRVGRRLEVEREFFIDFDLDLGVRTWQGYVMQGQSLNMLLTPTRALPDGSLSMVLSTDFGSRVIRWGFGATVGWAAPAEMSIDIPAGFGSPAMTVSGNEGGPYWGLFMRVAVGQVARN